METKEKKISVVFGTRPEAIKLAPVVKELLADGTLAVELCSTGQHREILEQAMRILELKADVNLDLMEQHQSLASFSSIALSKLDRYLAQSSPDVLLAQGDTTTTFIAGLAAFYRRVPIAHVEAGLRSHDKQSPFPEEMNRTLMTRLADLHFAPTELSRDNLLREGVPSEAIFVTGNTAVDSIQEMVSRVDEGDVHIPSLINRALNSRATGKMVLVTTHRRESFGADLDAIWQAIVKLSMMFEDTLFLCPLHPNPNVRSIASQYIGTRPNIVVTDPLDYPLFVYLMSSASLILTDSGGVQEEAPSLGKQVLVLRNVTERPEGISNGFVKVVGTEQSRIIEEVKKALSNKNALRKGTNPYGDGRASHRIVHALKYFLRVSDMRPLDFAAG